MGSKASVFSGRYAGCHGENYMSLRLIGFSAFLYVIAFPSWNAGVTIFFALVPFFWAIENARSMRHAIGCGGIWGLVASAGMGYWLLPTLIDHFNVWPPKAVLFFLVSVAVPSCLIYGGFAAAYRFVHHRHLAWYLLAVPSMWTLAEYLKEMVPFLIPWGSIGYATLPFHRFVQIADIGGVHGLTAVIVMINAANWFMVRLIVKTPSGVDGPIKNAFYAPAVILILTFSLSMAYGSVQLNWLEKKISEKMTVSQPLQAVLVQGNFDLDERWSGMGFYGRLQTYLDMSTRADRNGQSEDPALPLKRVIVWSETTLNEPVRLNDALFQQIMEVLGDKALLITGGLNQDDATGQVTNCAYLVSEGILTRYDKRILLPYAETSTMVDWLGEYYTAPSEFAAGRTPPCMLTPHGRVGVSICFEILYPGYIARSVNQGAVFLVNMSNDAWFGDSPMPHMHLNAARMRAIENRRFMLRTANSGISALISPSGAVLTRTDLFERKAIAAEFTHLDTISPYTRYGDWVVLLSAGILLLILFRMIFKKE
jgi:apolipoprotein N-acyltransferase